MKIGGASGRSKGREAKRVPKPLIDSGTQSVDRKSSCRVDKGSVRILRSRSGGRMHREKQKGHMGVCMALSLGEFAST